MIEYSDVIQEAVTILEDQDNIVTMSTGVKLRFTDVPPFLIQTVIEKFKVPKVPIIFDGEQGRKIENKNDPEYQQALEEYEANLSKATLDVILAFGTEIVEIPSTVEPPDSDDWIEVLAEIGVEVKRDSQRARKLMWLRTFGVKTPDDIAAIGDHYGEATGTGEKAVADAMESSFPGES